MKYSKDFKLDTLNILQEGKNVGDISKSLGISINTLCTWCRGYQLHGDKVFQGPEISGCLKTNNEKSLGN